MNNDTIKAAEEFITDRHDVDVTDNLVYLPVVDVVNMLCEFSAKKDDQIKELVEAIEDHMNSVGGGKTKCGHDFDCVCAWNNLKQLIQKYKG